MECKNIICVSKIIISTTSFLNQWRNKICKICESKTMDDLVNAYSDDIEGIFILSRIITVQCYTVW